MLCSNFPCCSHHRSTNAEMQLKLAFPASARPPGAATFPPPALPHPGRANCGPGEERAVQVMLALDKGQQNVTLHISWLPKRSIFPVNLRLSRVAATADCVNRITAHDSGNFSIPPLLTFTRGIYRLLKLPLPHPIPEGSLLGAERCCESRCHLSGTNSKAPAPFYTANLLKSTQLLFSNYLLP